MRKIRTLSADSPDTIQRTYRFDAVLFNSFEDDCATHLSNPKRVVEALLMFWMEADPQTRATLARKHRDRIGRAKHDK